MRHSKSYTSAIVSLSFLATLLTLNSCGAVDDEASPEGKSPTKYEGLAVRDPDKIEDMDPEKLEKIGRAHGMNGQELKKLAKDDRRLKADKEDKLFYECPSIEEFSSEMGLNLLERIGEEADAAEFQEDPEGLSLQEFSLLSSEAFLLHSRPSASRKIFLDFNGHVTSGTSWNSMTGLATIVSPAYDKDGNPTTFNATEVADIQAIWRAVSEDYAQFDVDVTTEDPGNVYLTGKGVRVVIGGAGTDWYGNAGGVAYLNSFGRANTPAFVFSKSLGPDFPKFVWEAASHEAGHTLGLYHDGKLATSSSAAQSYYGGQGSWAPIMGVGYSKAVTQFDKGEYANTNNKQDDLAVMTKFLTLRVDDHGNTQAAARPLTGTTVNATGVISERNDVDMFAFNMGTGPATLSAQGIAPWTTKPMSNVLLRISLLNSSGVVMATSTPDFLNSSLNVTISSAGTYYLRVDGVGSGDPAMTGYSDYGSLGQYTLTGTVPAR